jgi:hypothetical protein
MQVVHPLNQESQELGVDGQGSRETAGSNDDHIFFMNYPLSCLNVDLEVFLSYPFDMTNTIEHKKNCMGAQNLIFLYDLNENYCQKDARLGVR